MQVVFIALGSNIGNRLRNLHLAAGVMRNHENVRMLAGSKIYETAPVGPRQRNFLNAAVKIETELRPLELLALLKRIERAFGREVIEKWGPRPIDLDIIFYGQKRVKSRELEIPHPRYHERKFVLKPLCDIDPSFKPLGSYLSVSQILSRLTDPGQKVKLHSQQILEGTK